MSETPVILPTQQGYDLWAGTYDTDGNPLIALEEPQVAALLGDVRNLRILDVGCGTGRHSIRLVAAGAQVDAIDFSVGMLARAQQKSSAGNVHFQSHDLTKPLPFPDRIFDRTLCALVLDHIPDLQSLFKEMHRVTRADGHVIISVMHPAMMLRGVQARFHDAATAQEIRPASVDHQLTDYTMAAIRAGYTIDHLSEHTVNESLAARLPRAQRYLNWPMLFVMRLQPKS